MKKLAFLIFVALVMTSCCNCGRTSKDAPTFTDTTWSLIQLGGTSLSAEGKYEITFSVEGRITGIGFCNRLTGSYTNGERERTISFTPMASTKMACIESNVESEFFQSFEGVTSYAIDGKKLYLFANGELRAVFEAQP